MHRGEVLGFAGLIGAGRTDVGLALFGIEPATAGTIVLGGRPVTIRSPNQAMALGIAYLSEDRRQLGLSLPMAISANISLPVLRRYLNRLGLVRTGEERTTAELYRRRLAIRAPSVDLAVSKLSGGNQQKVMLGKWLNTQPSLLILDEPTRGVDVGAKAEVHAMIAELVAEGIGIMLISSELPEVLTLSDRVLVMREGRQMAIFSREEANEETIMAAAMGQAMTQEAAGLRREVAAAPCPAGADPRAEPPLPDPGRDRGLRLPDRQLLHLADVQSHRLERGDHHGGGRRPDAGRAHAQHRSFGRLDRGMHRLFRRHPDRRASGTVAGSCRAHGSGAWRRHGRDQRRHRRLGTSAFDHRHARDARDLPRAAHRLFRRQDRDHRQPARLDRRAAAPHAVHRRGPGDPGDGGAGARDRLCRSLRDRISELRPALLRDRLKPRRGGAGGPADPAHRLCRVPRSPVRSPASPAS